jgi:hypothetical protein
MNGYKSVYIRRIDPDGIRIIHESGAAKIPIEKLTYEQCVKYHLTSKGAAEYRKISAKNEAAAILAAYETAARAERQKPQPPPRPPLKFATAQQVKDSWIRNMERPRRLDPNYNTLLRAYHNSIASIQRGSRDMEAQEMAANYNKNLATRAGEIEIAKTFESELARISKEKTAAYECAKAASEAERERTNYLELQSRLRNLENLLREKSCTH